MPVPYVFASIPNGNTIPLSYLDANFSYLETNPVFSGNVTIDGTLSIIPLTQGSILFSGSGGIVSQNNSKLYWDNTNNQLGIGTTTLNAPLTIQTNINAQTYNMIGRATDGLSSFNFVSNDHSTVYASVIGGNSFVMVATAGSTRLTIDGSGNVGIGQNPTARLSVLSPTNNGISVTDGTVTTIIWNSASIQAAIGTKSNHSLTFWTNNTGKALIDTSGNFGVGTTTPSYRLDVYTNDASIQGARIQNGSSSSYAYSSLWIDNDIGGVKSALIKNSTTNVGNVGVSSSFYMYYDDTGISGIFNNSATPIKFFTSATQRVIINEIGRVGIGTSVLNAPLCIQTSAAAQTLNLIGRNSDGLSSVNFLNNAANTAYAAFVAGSGFFEIDVSGSAQWHITPTGMSVGSSLASSRLTVTGGLTAAAWTTAGIRLTLPAATFTDSSSSGTVASIYGDAFKAVTFAASSATTYTNAYGAFFETPVAGTNATLTNAWALGATTLIATGAVSFTSTLSVTGHVTLEGVTSTGATGTGALVFATSPTFVTPSLGTPSSGTLTNCTGLPASSLTGTTLPSGITSSSLTSFGASLNISTGKFIADASGNVTAALGYLSNGIFSGTYTDGTVIDYATGNGRISVGSADTLTFYTGGIATTQTAQISTAGVITAAGGVLSPGSSGIGYSTGAGGTVTQGTSRTNGVTLSKITGAITMFSAAGSATPATFTVTNTTVAATDVVLLSIKSGATNVYNLSVSAVAAGSFNITFYTTGGTATDAPVINFAVIKAVTA